MTERFETDWLALREPADHGARSAALTRALAARLGPAPAVVDLACGRGSTLAYLAPHLGPGQTWRLVDHDGALLEAAAARAPGVAVETLRADLSRDLTRALAAPVDLVTASALLDLAGPAWLARLAAHTRRLGAAALLTLTYDGRAAWAPSHPLDETLRGAVNRDQQRDKGLGVALGPHAAEAAARTFRREGFEVLEAASDWDLGDAERSLQTAFAEGWARAAAGAVDEASRSAWLATRRGWLARGESRLVVGHRDLLALPPVDAGP